MVYDNAFLLSLHMCFVQISAVCNRFSELVISIMPFFQELLNKGYAEPQGLELGLKLVSHACFPKTGWEGRK